MKHFFKDFTQMCQNKSLPTITGIYEGSHKVGQVCRIPILSNNSCLFLSLSYLLHRNSISSNVLRDVAAKMIESDPETFNDITLERSRLDYIHWIRQEESWGGYIELIALAKFYSIQLFVIDLWSGRQDEYGSDSSGRCVYLLYDGLHYDAFAAEDACCAPIFCFLVKPQDYLNTSYDPSSVITIFDSGNSVILGKIREIVSELRLLRKTSVPMKMFECCLCNKQFSSQNAMKIHAQETGHSQMQERQ
ncbi:ubiquitin thioesterase OTU1-like [Hylaeus volcanicus]|uniref:ubiquitin thioesterase OTU1-like n=1 Tax=Hylaeus volcanicus TaxID=313075 RepID=UPI0023B77411|nr:ubiquitin thioesterase OTU1-like [Hylaeus volcanicus]